MSDNEERLLASIARKLLADSAVPQEYDGLTDELEVDGVIPGLTPEEMSLAVRLLKERPRV